MLNIPEEIKNLYRQSNNTSETTRLMKLRFYDRNIDLLYPGEDVWPADDLFPVDDTPVLLIAEEQILQESFTLTQMLCDGVSLTFGDCDSSRVEITVADVMMDVIGKEFTLSVEVGGYEMMLGIYKVDSFVRQADRRLKKIVAYDRMQRFHTDVAVWYQGLTFPMTLKQFRDSLCTYVGIGQRDITLPMDDMKITKSIDPQQLFGLDVMRAICEINGCFGQIDVTGRFKYVYLGNASLFPADELFPADDLFPAEMEGETLSHYKPSGTTYEDYLVYGIEKVEIRQEEGDVGASYGPGGNTYTIQGNFLVYGKSANELLQIAATVYDKISRKVYRPCKIVTAGLPWVEPGDGIICYTSDDVIETYCLKRTIKGIQAMMDTFEAQGTQEIQPNFGIDTQIIQLEGKTAIIKKSVEEVSVRVTDLKEYTEAQFKMTADQILAEVTRAKGEEALLAASIKINADQIALKVSKGEVSSQLSVESDKVVLQSNRLIVDSTNFQLDGNGNATFSGDVRGARIYASYINGGSIDIGNGTFGVHSDGSVVINAGSLDLGPVRINENYTDLGAFRVSKNTTGALVSTDGEIWLTTKAFDTAGPALEFQKNGKVTTRVGWGGIVTGDIDLGSLKDAYGQTWESVSKNIIELWNRVENIESQI